MQTYLIAGGAGFIGSHICERLINKGFGVICVDNLITGDENNISHLFSNQNFVFINQDIIRGVSSINHEIKGIFHLASPASPSQKKQKELHFFPYRNLTC